MTADIGHSILLGKSGQIMQSHREGKEDQMDVLGLVLNAPPRDWRMGATKPSARMEGRRQPVAVAAVLDRAGCEGHSNCPGGRC